MNWLQVQLGSITTEAIRLALVQILLQKRGIKLNPITTLYYISPCCFAFLMLPFFFVDLPHIMSDDDLKVTCLRGICVLVAQFVTICHVRR